MDDTLIAFLLDRTGSMSQIKDDVIGSFNEFLRAQRAVDGKCRFVLTLFDSQSIDTTDYPDVAQVPELTDATYQPRASTPLYDAIASTITAIDDRQIEVDRILFVIQTDGYENASRSHTKDSVRRLIEEHQGEGYGWDFVFLGADIDAMAEAVALGIPQDHTISYASVNTSSTMDSVNSAVTDYRSGGDWEHTLQEAGSTSGGSSGSGSGDTSTGSQQ